MSSVPALGGIYQKARAVYFECTGEKRPQKDYVAALSPAGTKGVELSAVAGC